jgi:hypothetical protein
VARRGSSDDPILAAIFTAQNVNAALGGQYVTPWDVGQLPQEWVDACIALSVELPKIKTGVKEMDDFMASWKAKNAKRQ